MSALRRAPMVGPRPRSVGAVLTLALRLCAVSLLGCGWIEHGGGGLGSGHHGSGSAATGGRGGSPGNLNPDGGGGKLFDAAAPDAAIDVGGGDRTSGDANPSDAGLHDADADTGRVDSGPAGAGGASGGVGGAGGSGVSGTTCARPSSDDAWQLVVAPTLPFASDILAFRPDDVWAVALTSISHWNGRAWAANPVSPPVNGGKLSGSGSSDLWYADDPIAFHFYHFDGLAWANRTPALANNDLAGQTQVWSIPFDRAWAVVVSRPAPSDGGFLPSQTYLFGWDGVSWSRVSAPRTPTAMWGAAADDVWATAGDSLMHWNGVSWTLVALPGVVNGSATAASIWGSAASDIWAVGGDGSRARAWHYDGARWVDRVVGVATGSPGSAGLQKVWGSCPSNFYASPGSGDVIWRFDGSVWTSVALPAALSVASLTGGGVDDVWVLERSFPPNASRILRLRPGICGDGIVQTAGGETCDVAGGSPFCTGCTSNSCEGCRDAFCGAPSCGDPGAPGSDSCHALDACLARGLFRCAVNAMSALGCYCSDATCSMGANGSCVAEFEAVANSHDPAEVLRQYHDPQSVIARVSSSATCMAMHGAPCGMFCRN